MESPLTNISVLIVDDERNIRNTVSRTLANLGAITATASNGLEALDRIREADIDVVLLDLKLPHIDGLEVLQLMRQEHPTLPIIIFSAHGTPEIAAQAMKLGASDYLDKPFTPDVIRTAVIDAVYEESTPSFHTARQQIPANTSTENTGPPTCIAAIISNPNTTLALLRIAASITREHSNSEVFAFSPVIVPLQTPLAVVADREEGPAEAQRQALDVARGAADDLGIKLHSNLLLAHRGSNAVLDFIDEHNAAHLVLEWSDEQPDKSCLSLSDVQTIVHKTSAEVTLVKTGHEPQLQHIVALVSRSAHAARAVRRAWALAQHVGLSQLMLIHVLKSSADERDQRKRALQLIHHTASEVGIPPNKYDSSVLIDDEPQKRLLAALADFDTVFVGATEKTWLAQTLFGSVPDAVTSGFDGTVAVVQGRKSSSATFIDAIIDRLAG